MLCILFSYRRSLAHLAHSDARAPGTVVVKVLEHIEQIATRRTAPAVVLRFGGDTLTRPDHRAVIAKPIFDNTLAGCERRFQCTLNEHHERRAYLLRSGVEGFQLPDPLGQATSHGGPPLSGAVRGLPVSVRTARFLAPAGDSRINY